LPRFNSPLLRHFVVGQVIGNPSSIKPGAEYLSGQLVVHTAEFDDTSFEIVASYTGAPLVIVGRRDRQGGRYLVQDLAVLGPDGELYQYFMDEISWAPGLPEPEIAFPPFDPAEYVAFPEEGNSSVAIRPVKDWLVFQATLPNGRPLNLVFDSGAEMMILDDMVLELDANLEPAGEVPVAGAFESAAMKLYEGFSFNVGGVNFRNLPVIGTQLTSLGYGAGLRIHGIVGHEMLQLCRLDLDLEEGQLQLSRSDSPQPEQEQGEEVPLTFIRELPHVEAELHDNGSPALLLVDTGQRSPLSVNLDYLDSNELGDDLVMDGFQGDITGGLRPRYMIEELDLKLAGRTYREKTVDAGLDGTYVFDGRPVAGSIGFSLLARHFGGITFDYSRKLMYLREPAENREFSGRPEEWEQPPALGEQLFAYNQEPAPTEEELAAQRRQSRTQAGAWVSMLGLRDIRRPKLLPDHEDEDPHQAYDWSQILGDYSDPLSLVRSSTPGGLDSRDSARNRAAIGDLPVAAVKYYSLLAESCGNKVYAQHQRGPLQKALELAAMLSETSLAEEVTAAEDPPAEESEPETEEKGLWRNLSKLKFPEPWHH
jgi:hypothetical protein